VLPDRSTTNDFWCPLNEASASVAQQRVTAAMTPAEWADLSRVAVGEWVSERQIERLNALGLAETVFGQTLLTRLGRATLGTGEREQT
jgi:hypothetical protein